MKPLIYAHRGASTHFAEHTRAAYMQALADGADGVECDVHLTQDGQVVLIHDDTLERTSNGFGDVTEHTLNELRELDFCSWKGAQIPDEFGGVSRQLLTLSELLDILLAAGRDIGLAIEFKHSVSFDAALEQATLAVLISRGWVAEGSKLGNVAISFMSFSPDSLETMANYVSGDQLCQLVDDVDAEDIAASLDLGPVANAALALLVKKSLERAERNLDDGTVGLAGPGIDYVRRHPERIQTWLTAGRRFRVWTVDAPEDVDLCVSLGIHEITANDPAAVRGVIR